MTTFKLNPPKGIKFFFKYRKKNTPKFTTFYVQIIFSCYFSIIKIPLKWGRI